jgi:hypothetical protein
LRSKVNHNTSAKMLYHLDRCGFRVGRPAPGPWGSNSRGRREKHRDIIGERAVLGGLDDGTVMK